LFDRPESGEDCLLVQVGRGGAPEAAAMQEFCELAASAGARCVGEIQAPLRGRDPGLFVGSGKAEEIRRLVLDSGARLVIFDAELSPSQERNLERLFEARVLDRTGLILDIFAQRARSFEGKLQVELAQLRHLATRLVRGWTHLERQRGGIGLRGPGETQLETDRRLLQRRIESIEQRLQRVEGQREQGRRARVRAELPTLALVGYTNAGKSTLFNRLTGAGVYAQDQLFATLDPTVRRVALPEAGSLILADTVGFVSHLPHELVAAFRATLREVRDASLLLHVVDAASPVRDEQIAAVEAVLAEIGANDVPRIEICNKIDLLPEVAPRIDRDGDGMPQRVWCSAHTGAGIDAVLAALAERFRPQRLCGRVRLSPDQGRLRALLHRVARVRGEDPQPDGGLVLDLEIEARDYARLMAREGMPSLLPADPARDVA
jgi:GTP-binding protein HflX